METPSDRRISVTSSETGERKHLVQPYSDAPMMRRIKGEASCEFCGNPGFRRSRLRWSDAATLLLLRYPVRCTRCGQRQHAPVWVAASAFAPRTGGN